MKILFINKYDTSGGAAITAMRLARSLMDQGFAEVRFLVGVRNSSLPFVYQTREPGFQTNLERIWNYASNRLGMQYLWFPYSSKKILDFCRHWNPDIISLQNAHGGYLDLGLLPGLSGMAPLVWTLHDMWAFTGNAAHTFGDTSWKNLNAGRRERHHFPEMGLPTGNMLLRRKYSIYQRSNLTLVSPSDWLYRMARESPLFAGKKLVHIPNGVPLDKFLPMTRSLARKELGLPESGSVVSFSAEKLMSSEFKGGPELLRVLQELDARITDPLLLIMMGKDRLGVTFSRLQCHQTGYLSDEDKLIRYLQASDLFLYPTRADNLPNSLIEAIACGVPCITFDAGGCREIIRDGYNGFVIPPSNSELFAQKVLSLLSDPVLARQMSLNARRFAEERYGADLMGKNYARLFEQVLNSGS